MKKSLIVSLALLVQVYSNAQCGAPVSGGSASNMLTNTRGSTNPVAADKNLNTVAFVHRNNTGSFGGTTGHLNYDISTNGGTSWTTDIGFLNPLISSFARYPNMCIYNPPANTTPNNAYIGYLAATVSTLSAAWNGVVSGVRQISGTGNTENYNQPIVNPSLISGSLVKGGPGVYWSIDALFNGTNITGYTIYKGVWNSGLNDIVWSNNFNVNVSFHTGLTITGAVPADYNIAFDPTGQIGYFSFLGHITGGPANYAYYPTVYKTTNGGTTWTGPTVIDITQFSCLTTNVTSPNVPTTNFEHDLTVDVNGNPHLLTTLGNGNNAYAIFYGSWHHVFDITLKNGLWAAYDLGNVMAGRGTWGPVGTTVSQDMAPRIARSADGTKVFFTWSDNSNYTAGQANLSPNMFSKAYNVTTGLWTLTKDFSSCGLAAGKIIFPHLAHEVLEPSAGVYKLAPVYGEFSTIANDPNLVSNFKFLDNAEFAIAEFSVATPAAVVNIQPTPVLLCPGSTITLNTANPIGQFLWSTGATSSAIAISSPTITSYSVVAQQACLVGTANVTVAQLTLSANAVNPSFCKGSSSVFTVTGNALGYTWTPGGITGTHVSVSPTTNTVTLSALGSGNCTYTQTVLVNLLPQPTLTAAGPIMVCDGSVFTQTISGAQTYLWNNASTSATFTDIPACNTVYTVTGTAANSCTNTLSVFVTVNPKPTITAISTATAICSGNTVGLTGGGAISYTWNSVPSPSNIVVSPNVTTVFTVTGEDANLCVNSKTISVVVNPTPTLTVTSTPTAICIGQTATLTASGAFSYSWQAVTSPPSITVAPVVATVYSVTGASTVSCKSTETINIIVNSPPTVTITPARTGLLCKGEKMILTASGASTYSWVTPSAQGSTVEVTLQNSVSYFVTGTNTEGCTHTKSFSVSVSNCTGIDEHGGTLQLLSIYPNPSKGELTISAEKALDLRVINSLGQTVKLLSLNAENRYSVFVNDLAEGVYFIIDQNGTEQATHKIVITR